MQTRSLYLMMAIIGLITACGQSGPLYLPPPVHSPAPNSIDNEMSTDAEPTSAL